MDPLLAVIIAMAMVLFVVAVYMEWLGLLSVVASRKESRHAGCGHLKLTPANELELCWHCRHKHLDHALHPFHSEAPTPLLGDQTR
ncbi:MAG TPA: hypothetical protein VHC43_05310 [Mycobacteriales bacterium]|nr:hypothetical protein [Mycobacteriales bacterium]